MKYLYEVYTPKNNCVVTKGEIEDISKFFNLSKSTVTKYIDEDKLIKNTYKIRKVDTVTKRQFRPKLKINPEAFNDLCEYIGLFSNCLEEVDCSVLEYTCNRIREKIKRNDGKKIITKIDVQKYLELYEV